MSAKDVSLARIDTHSHLLTCPSVQYLPSLYSITEAVLNKATHNRSKEDMHHLSKGMVLLSTVVSRGMELHPNKVATM